MNPLHYNIATPRKISPDTYCVCLIDLLGQQRILSDFPQQLFEKINPQSESDGAKATDTICYIRDSLFELAKYLKSPPEELLTTLEKINPIFCRNVFLRKYSTINIGIQQFSDTIVTYVQLPITDHDRSAIVGIISAWLSRLSTLMLECMSLKIPIRGAITIGYAWEIGENNLYGPAIAHAHHMESKKAAHPRILVDPTVLSWLETIRTGVQAKSGKLFTSDKIFQDIDSLYAIDYLENCKNQAKYSEWGQDAYRFICDQLTLHKKTDSEEAKKLVSRYTILKQYFDDKL